MKVVYSVGYGGRSLSELLNLLKYYGIEVVVDVRRWNRSLKVPEFSGNNLESALKKHNVRYYWLPVLGGYRKFGVDVEDLGMAKCFESEGFRAYATYIATKPEVVPFLEKLLELTSNSTSAILCRERYPWLCHRKILSDYLVIKGLKVLHIVERNKLVEHKLSKCAVVDGGELRYI
ncbi:MAG: DUF488 family protein [Desulfurococcaceae archaeon]